MYGLLCYNKNNSQTMFRLTEEKKMEQTVSSKAIRKENLLGTEKIGKLLMIYAVPGIISMVVNSIYNIVDQIFIGRGVGYMGNGATNVIFPMSVLALAFSMMVGNGAGAYMSLMLGRKQEKDAARGVAAGLFGLLGVGFILMAVYLIFMEPLCRMFGATDAILPYALDYGYIIAMGLPLFCICAGFSSVIRSDGSPRWNMVGLLTGCLINLILDPTFIFVFHMGVKGAALATILGQMANALIALLYIKRMKTVKLTRETFAGWRQAFPSVVSLGTSSFIAQFVMVIAIAVQNNVLVRYGAYSEYGAEIPMTALGVTMKIFSILSAILIGLATGAQPILGYNYGAQKYERVKTTFKYVITISISAMCVAWVLFQLFPGPIVGIFGHDSEMYTKFSIRCLKIFLLGIPVGAIPMMSSNFFQSVGKPMQASIVSLSKQVFFMIPLTLLLPGVMGVEGVLWAGCFSDVLAFVLCLYLFKRYWNRLFESPEIPASQTAPQAAFQMASAARGGAGFLGDGQVAAESAPNVIITIGRTYGSPGSEVGRAVAKELQIPYYDGEILEQAAENSGLSRRYMEHVDENMRSFRLIYNIAPLWNVNADAQDSLRQMADEAQSEIILQAAQGPCVIIGRRADQVLKEFPNVVRIFITAQMEDRIKAVSKAENLSAEDARKRIEDIDRHRANYYGELNGMAWGRADNYDICINTSATSVNGAIFMIRNTVEGKLIQMRKLQQGEE